MNRLTNFTNKILFDSLWAVVSYFKASGEAERLQKEVERLEVELRSEF